VQETTELSPGTFSRPYDLVLYPDPRLSNPTTPILGAEAGWPGHVHDLIEGISARMIQTMREHNGLGIAAPQIGLSLRICVVSDVTAPGSEIVLVNPKIQWSSPEMVRGDEGCLSFPGVIFPVDRHATVEVVYSSPTGPSVLSASGLLARCVQHELDHLDGFLFIQRASPADAVRIRPALKRLAAASVR